MASLPVIGTVAAGEPILAEQNITNYFPVPAEMVPGGALISQMAKYGFNPWNNRNMTNIRTIDGMNAFEISKVISDLRRNEDPTKVGDNK